MSQHVVMYNEPHGATLATQPAPIAEGVDYAGWSIMTTESAGVSVIVLKGEPDAVEFPMHAVPDAYFGYVVAGQVIIHAGNADGEKLDETTLTAGDLLTLEPDTQHAWVNTGGPAEIIFTKPA
ncbi:MAG: cupin domain-containing protein [Planctomycetota bacterium]